ncbi:MAG: methylated-DNA--[protein]-cysteine S-methyltransferase [Chloroflexota bacterium]|nr:methylated-DNA--[protein]-cysteine S-methyltransferase [Chloroflexota bacterium]
MLTTYYRSPIGILEITGSQQGIASIDFVVDAIENGGTPPALQDCVLQLDEYFAGERKEFSLKLDLQGTEFQRKVWRELQRISFGKTVSYLDVAVVVGTRESTRAVGRANGQNPIAIVVPCHRVIGSDGSLTGYGGGLWRKRWLLDFESNTPQPSLFASALEPNATRG